ncbi:InlB B-repeat-containing protein [Oscillospiraceae bacterium MB08-C2-2]|nr:InlB B-repeat-containing protein [Oscillospiraceae bacterium MB08-C2-2]
MKSPMVKYTPIFRLVCGLLAAFFSLGNLSLAASPQAVLPLPLPKGESLFFVDAEPQPAQAATHYAASGEEIQAILDKLNASAATYIEAVIVLTKDFIALERELHISVERGYTRGKSWKLTFASASGNPVLLYAPPISQNGQEQALYRHLYMDSLTVTLIFNKVVLDGTGAAGGVYYRGAPQERTTSPTALTLGGAVLQNCNRTADSTYSSPLAVSQCDFIMTGGELKKNRGRRGGALGLGPGTRTVMTNVKISGNQAVESTGRVAETNKGGGILASGQLTEGFGQTQLSLTGCEISGNTAYEGAGIHVDTTGSYSPGSTAQTPQSHTYDSVTITGNRASAYGGGLSLGRISDADAAQGLRPLVQATIQSSEISGNTAGLEGGGIYARWQAPKMNMTGSLVIEGSKISGNTAGSVQANGKGGGISASSLSLTNSTVEKNSVAGRSSAQGGGLFLGTFAEGFAADLSLSGTSFNGNQAKGSLFFQSAGGGIYSESPLTVTLDAGISDNSADHGGGIWINRNLLVVRPSGYFSGNRARGPYMGLSARDMALHKTHILTNRFTRGLQYGYNNLDIVFSNNYPYLVRFYRGVDDPNPTEIEVNAGDRVPQPAIVEGDPPLLGWYQNPDFRESSKWNFSTRTMPCANLDLYAKWGKEPETIIPPRPPQPSERPDPTPGTNRPSGGSSISRGNPNYPQVTYPGDEIDFPSVDNPGTGSPLEIGLLIGGGLLLLAGGLLLLLHKKAGGRFR